jgi:hypothetical protein
MRACTEDGDRSSRFEPVHAEEMRQLPFGDQFLLAGGQGKVLIAPGECVIGRGEIRKPKLALCLTDLEPAIS